MSVTASLSYRVVTLINTNRISEVFLMETATPTIGPFKLPEGDRRNQFARDVVVSIIDVYGESTLKQYTVYVSISQLANNISCKTVN